MHAAAAVNGSTGRDAAFQMSVRNPSIPFDPRYAQSLIEPCYSARSIPTLPQAGSLLPLSRRRHVFRRQQIEDVIIHLES